MECLYCGDKLGLLSGKGRQFCNKKHQELWRQREAELSIQRLKDAFGFSASPAKSKQTATSVLDPLADDAPPSELEYTFENPHPRALPPASKFSYDDPRDPPVESPRSRAIPEGVTAGAGVFYCGPASEQETPPNAGFVGVDERKARFRLPFYIRRPEAASTSGSQRSSDLLAHQAVSQRDVLFVTDFCVTLVDVCTKGQPGHSLPQPSLELRYSELLRKSVEEQIRKLAFQVCQAPGAALQSQYFAPKLEEPTVRGAQPAQPVHAQPSVQEPRPMALSRQEPECQPVFSPDPEIIPATLPVLPAGWIQPTASAQLPEQLPATFGRAMPAPPSCSFKALAGAQIAGFRYATPAATTCAASMHRELAPRVQVQPRAFHALPMLSSALKTQTIVGSPHTKPAALPYAVSMHRDLAPRLQVQLRAFHALPMLSSALKTQTIVGSPHTKPAALPYAVSMHRELAPRLQVQSRAFQALQVGSTALQTPAIVRSPHTTPATLPCAVSMPRELGPRLQAQSRVFEFRAGRLPGSVPGTLLFAASARHPKATVYSVAEHCCDTRPAALRRREPARRSVISRGPEIIAASLPPVALSTPRAAARAKAPQAPAVALGRPMFLLPNCAFQALVSRQSAPTHLTAPAVVVSIAWPQYLDAPVHVHPRPLELQDCKALQARAFAPTPENLQTKAFIAPERGYLAPPSCEVRPIVLRRRETERPPVVMLYPEIIPVHIPHLDVPYPQPAVSTKATRALPVALPVAITRRMPALPHSKYHALVAGLGAPAEHTKPATAARANLPQPKLGPKLYIPLRQAKFQKRAGRVELQIQAFAPTPEKSEARVYRASEPVCQVAPPAREVRPMALHWRAAERRPELLPCPETIAASLPRMAARDPLTAAGAGAGTLGVAVAREIPTLAECTFRALAGVDLVPARRTRPLTALRADLPHYDLPAVQVPRRKRELETWKAASPAPPAQTFELKCEPSQSKVHGARQPVFEAPPQGCQVRPMALRRRSVQRPAAPMRHEEILASSPRSQTQRSLAAAPTPTLGALDVAARSGIATLPNSIFQALEAAQCAPTTYTRAVIPEVGCSLDVALRVLARDPQFEVPVSMLHDASYLPGPMRSLYEPEFVAGDPDYSFACPARPAPAWNHMRPITEPFMEWPESAREAASLDEETGAIVALFTADSSFDFVPIKSWTQRTDMPNVSALLEQFDRRHADRIPVSAPVAASHPAQPSTVTPARVGIPAGKKRELTWVACKIPWSPLP